MTYFSAARDEEIQNTRKMLAVLPDTYCIPLLSDPRSYSRFILMTYFSAARDKQIQNTRKMLAVLPETNWFMRFQTPGATVDIYCWLIFLLPGMRRYKTRGKCWQFCQRLTIIPAFPDPRSYNRLFFCCQGWGDTKHAENAGSSPRD
jgi:hypothetical protein